LSESDSSVRRLILYPSSNICRSKNKLKNDKYLRIHEVFLNSDANHFLVKSTTDYLTWMHTHIIQD
jgi:hypothetical protein